MLFVCPLLKLFRSIQECWDQRVWEMIDLFVCSPLWPECQNHPHPVCKAPTRFIALKCASDNNHLQLSLSRKWQQQISICCWKKEMHLRSKHIHQGDSTRHMKSSGPTWLMYEEEQTSLRDLREDFVFVFVCIFYFPFLRILRWCKSYQQHHPAWWLQYRVRHGYPGRHQLSPLSNHFQDLQRCSDCCSYPKQFFLWG